MMLSLIARLRQFVGNRRRAARFSVGYEVRLVAGITAFDPSQDFDIAQKPKSFVGHTRNISEGGLSLFLPSISKDDYVINEGDKLTILIVLPMRSIKLYATPVYCKLLNKENPQEGYIIGLRIIEMSNTDRSYFVQYLKTLR